MLGFWSPLKQNIFSLMHLWLLLHLYIFYLSFNIHLKWKRLCACVHVHSTRSHTCLRAHTQLNEANCTSLWSKFSLVVIQLFCVREEGPWFLKTKRKLPLCASVSEKSVQIPCMGVKNSYSKMHFIPEGLFRVMDYLFCKTQVDFFTSVK